MVAESLESRVRRRLARVLLHEPATAFDAAALGAQVALARADLPGAYLRARGRVGRAVRRLRGREGEPAASPPLDAAAEHVGGASTMDGLPIIFLHRGNSAYLRYSLGQARRSNPRSAVVLLGDETNGGYEGVEHVHHRAFYTRAAELDRTYRHFSTNGLDYERFSFQRWLILDEFLAARGYEQCLYLDSDVLLFADVTEDRRRFADYDFTIAHDTGSVFFLNRRPALRELGDFILDIYRGRERYTYDRMVAHYVARRRNGLAGGSCDMTALGFFAEARYGRVGDVAVVRDGSVYDVAIGAEQGFLMRDGAKDLRWEGGIPYGTLASSGRAVRFNALHFQGTVGKQRIAHAFEQAGAAERAALPVNALSRR